MKKYVCGIDFGTSNTSLSIVSCEQSPRLALLDGPSATIASAIFFPHGNKAATYGKSAIDAYVERQDGRLMRSFKRALGTQLMQEGTQINGGPISFEQIITRFIAHIKSESEKQIDAQIFEATVGRPVHFVDGSDEMDELAQDQLESAILAAGFDAVTFQYEPIGAAFAHEARLDGREHLAIVLDIGGGTSDFSVIRVSHACQRKADRSDDILANTGVRIGGNDFDRRLCLQEIMPLLGMGTLVGRKNLVFPSYPFFDLAEWSKVQTVYAQKYKREVFTQMIGAHQPERLTRLRSAIEHEYGHLLLGLIERAKIELSECAETKIGLSMISKDLDRIVSIEQFESSIYREVQQIHENIGECLRQAGTHAKDISLVILTGGGTGVPAIRRLATSIFPNATVSSENMLGSVGLGLGYDAARRYLL